MEAKLLKKVGEHPDSTFKHAATERQIALAEKRLGVVFPTSYRQFLDALNGGELAFARMYRISPAGAGFFDLFEWMDQSSEHWPAFRKRRPLLFGDDYSRNYYCFDLTTRRRGECPVVYWDSFSSPEHGPEAEAPDLATFILDGLLRRGRFADA
jgi:hypothetical protein